MKNWCFWTVVLEKTLESPSDRKEIKPVNPKGNQSLIFTGRTDAEAETAILWPPNVKNWLLVKEPYAGKDWKQEEKGMTEDEMVGWHHWLDGHEFEQALGVGGQRSLVCYCPRGCKESDMTEGLNWSHIKRIQDVPAHGTHSLSLSWRDTLVPRWRWRQLPTMDTHHLGHTCGSQCPDGRWWGGNPECESGCLGFKTLTSHVLALWLWQII